MNNNKRSVRSDFRHSALALALSAALPVAIAHAEEAVNLPKVQVSGEALDGYKVEESTSIKYVKPLLDTAKTITVIPQALMKDRNVDSLSDALRNVPGISMAAGEGGTPSGDQMSIRGFDSRNNIMIDNIRDIAGYSRDTYNVESIEVAKGPGSAVYGRGSAGGSINLQTKTAKLDDFNDINFRLGSEDDYRTVFDTNHILGDTTAIRLNLLTTDGDVAGRDKVENSNDAIALSFATGIDTATRFTLNADYQKQDNQPDYGIPWVANGGNLAPSLLPYEGGTPNVNFSNYYGNVHRDFEDIDSKSLTAMLEQDISDSTTLRVTGRIGAADRESVTTAPRLVNGTTNMRLNDVKTRDTKDSLKLLQFDLIGKYQTGSITHDVVTGIEIAEEKFERWNYDAVVTDNLLTQTTNLYDPNSNLAFTGRYARTDKSQEATGDTKAIYAFDTLTLNEQWQVSLGLRYDVFDTEYYYNLDGSDATLPTSAKADKKDENLSWNTGVVYKPVENGSIYAAVGTSFTPAAEDLTASTRGNQASLDPEKTISYEVGTKWELFDSRLFTSAALFRTEKTNALSNDPFSTDANDRILDGEERVQGIELSAAGKITDQFTLTAAYTYQDSEVIKATGTNRGNLEGNELARTPKNSASVWGRYDFTNKLAAGLGAQYVGERYNSSDITGREKAESFTIWDAMVSYRIDEQWALQLNGGNLFNKKYINQVGGGHAIPGEGRYVSLNTSFSF